MKKSSRTSMTRLLLVSMMVGAMALPSKAKADPAREFIMSCSYGVLAGTLVGAATLAFSDKPGENLNKVARGASIGLYAGMLLGLYVLYGTPGEEEDVSVSAALNETGDSSLLLADAKPLPRVTLETRARLIEPPRLQVYPMIGERGLEGAAAQFALVRF